MRKCLMVLLVALAGCASQPGVEGTNTYANTGNESPARYRARLHTDLGSGYYAQGQMAVALEEFSKAAQIDPSYAQAHNGLGLVFAALREDEKSESSFRRALQLDPGSSEAHNNYGTFLCSRNRIDESIKEFLAALKNPLYATPESAWVNAGICALKKGNDTDAETYLQNALQLVPGLRVAHYQLAKLYFARGDVVAADRHFQQVMQGGEPTPEMLWLGIQIARTTGDRNAEASHAMLLRNKFPDSDEAKGLRAEPAAGR